MRMSDVKNSHRLLSEEDDGKVQRRKRKTMQRSKSSQGRPRRVATVILWKPSGLYSAAISQSSSLKSSTSSSSSSPAPSRSGFVLALWKQVKWLVTRRCWANASGRTTNSASSNNSVSRRRSCRMTPLEWPGEAAPDPKPAFWSIDREHRWPLQGW